MPGIMLFSEDMVPEKTFAPASLHESSSQRATTTPATITATEAVIVAHSCSGRAPRMLTSSHNGDTADVIHSVDFKHNKKLSI
jgi:hypothetical protein